MIGHAGIVPAAVVGAFTRGTDPVDESRRADYWTGVDVVGRQYRALIRSGDASTFTAPGYTWDLAPLDGTTGPRYSGHALSRAACEWEVFDALLDNGPDELDGDAS